MVESFVGMMIPATEADENHYGVHFKRAQNNAHPQSVERAICRDFAGTAANRRVNPPAPPITKQAPLASLPDCPPKEEPATDGLPAFWPPHS